MERPEERRVREEIERAVRHHTLIAEPHLNREHGAIDPLENKFAERKWRRRGAGGLAARQRNDACDTKTPDNAPHRQAYNVGARAPTRVACSKA
jgi:hypothetical protein